MNSGKMRPYRLFVKFYSPLILYHQITLDAILAYCIATRLNENKGTFCLPQQIQGSDTKIKHELFKIIEHNTSFSPVPMASYFQSIGSTTEYLDSWKKRFESKYSHLADFGKAKKQVDTGSGKYRSYNMPLPAVVSNMGFFAFIGDSLKVLDLLEKHIVSIGKKRSAGFGWIDKMEVRDASYTCFDIAGMRPIPKSIAEKNKITGMSSYCAWRSPYWLRKNICECVVPAS